MQKKGYHKLIVYQKARELVLLIYKITKTYPKEEQFILISQMRRASISIVANIAEGYSKESTKEYIRFLKIAIGSATELGVHLDISFELKYIDDKACKDVISLLEEVLKLLYSYKRSLEKRIKE